MLIDFIQRTYNDEFIGELRKRINELEQKGYKIIDIKYNHCIAASFDRYSALILYEDK